jgi:prepilin-type processing-associated H-X9-DG protein
MTHQHRSGLTRIEVVVIVVVVCLLLALLLPATQRSRNGDGRRNTCMNNQRQLAMVLLNYEDRNGMFPGYANRVGPADMKERLVASWAVVSLPFMESLHVYQDWERGVPTSSYMPVFVCPSGVSRFDNLSHPWLSYVVNCGLPGDKDDSPATGVFHNHNVDGKPVTVSADYISRHDGTPNTLLLSENLQAGLWTDTDEADVGMVWWREPGECNRINRCNDVGPRPQDIQYARPSSPHGGGVNAVFCDGHVWFLSDTIDYKVYQRLMAPNDERAGLAPNEHSTYDADWMH